MKPVKKSIWKGIASYMLFRNELLIGLGFGWVIYYSFLNGMYGAILFQMLFFTGFTYVAFLSLFQGKLTSR